MQYVFTILILLLLMGCDSRSNRSDRHAAATPRPSRQPQTANSSVATPPTPPAQAPSATTPSRPQVTGDQGNKPQTSDKEQKTSGNQRPLTEARKNLMQQNSLASPPKNQNIYEIWQTAVNAVRGVAKSPDQLLFAKLGVEGTEVNFLNNYQASVSGAFLVSTEKERDKRYRFSCKVLYVEDQYYELQDLKITSN